MHKYNQNEISLYFFAFTISLLLSFWLDYRESVINPDAICYLLSAEALTNHTINQAMQLCGQAKWPFFSMLIYGMVQLTHFSYITAAYFLNSIFSAISVIFFLLIVKEMGASVRILWLAALVILLSHEFNSVREYIIRDHGFWAFYLASVLFLIQFFRRPTFVKAFAWSGSLIIATLFRIEGVIFLLAMPFLSLFCIEYNLRNRIKNFFLLNLPLLLLGLLAGFWFLFHLDKNLDHLGKINDLINQFQNGLLMMTERFNASKAALASHVLTLDSANEAGLIFLLTLVSWYLISVISNLSWAYALVLIHAIQKKALTFALPVILVAVGYLIINVIVTFIFLLEHLFLSKRYLIALSLILMIFVPFALDYLIANRTLLRTKLFLFLVALLMMFSSTGGIVDFGYSKAYIHDAGDWLANNVPKNASLYVNDYQLMFYSRHYGENIFNKMRDYHQRDAFANGEWKQYDYIALRLDKHTKLNTEAISDGLKPVQLFSNKRGDKIIIYKVEGIRVSSNLEGDIL